MTKELVLINNIWVLREVTPTTSTTRTITYSYGSTISEAEFGIVSKINISSTTGSVA